MKSILGIHEVRKRNRNSVCVSLAIIFLMVPALIVCVPGGGGCQPHDLTADFTNAPPDGWWVDFTDQSQPTVYWYTGT